MTGRILPIFLVISAAVPARAYVRTTDAQSGACLFWPQREVPWLLNEKGSEDVTFGALKGALDRSFGAWQDVACSDVTFRYDGTTPKTDARFDRSSAANVNLLVWRETTCDAEAPATDACWGVDPDSGAETCADIFDCWDHGPGIIALTTMNYARSTGVIWDGDIEFNGSREANGTEFRFTATLAENPACTTATETGCVATDVQNTATHEIGHLIGLAHTLIADATMYASAPLGETEKRTLADDDVAGICDVYPSGQPPTTCTPSGHITIEPESGGCATPPGSVASLLVLAIAFRRRKSPIRTA